jgi:hypothetical protein
MTSDSVDCLEAEAVSSTNLVKGDSISCCCRQRTFDDCSTVLALEFEVCENVLSVFNQRNHCMFVCLGRSGEQLL